MLVYWSVYVVPALLSLASVRVSRLGWLTVGTMLSLFVGLRYGVGTDWSNYIRSYYLPQQEASFFDAVLQPDPAYQLLNWIAIQLGIGVWLVNLVAALIFTSGLIRFVRRLPEPLTGLTAALPYVVIVVGMNYSRQAVALGILLWGIIYLYDRRVFAYLGTVIVAALFHKSAIIFLPLVAFVGDRNKLGLCLMALASGVLGYFVFLAERLESLWQQYVVSDYSQESQGAPVRVAMDALPAVVFLVFRGRLKMHDVEKRVWTWIALASLACMVLVFQAPTAVDRVALYFSPIQFVVAAYFTRLVTPRSRVIARALVLVAYAGVLFIWLGYAANAHNWLPYRLWPFLSEGGGQI